MVNQISIFKVSRPKGPALVLDSSQRVADAAKEYRDASREVFLVFYVNTKNAVVHSEIHSIGCIDSAAVHPREVLKLALLKDAASIICVHNHPSGDPEPSICDRLITRNLAFACTAVGIKFLDHVILGSGEKMYSFVTSDPDVFRVDEGERK
jgi:DNA repair protein RadC